MYKKLIGVQFYGTMWFISQQEIKVFYKNAAENLAVYDEGESEAGARLGFIMVFQYPSRLRRGVSLFIQHFPY